MKTARAPVWRKCGVVMNMNVKHECLGVATHGQFDSGPKVCAAFVEAHKRLYPHVAHTWREFGRLDEREERADAFAFEHGEDAFLTGQSRERNPWSRGTAAYWNWIQGYEAAAQRRREEDDE